jgi:hypothetical protein
VRYSTPGGGGGGLTDSKSQVYVRQTPSPDPPDAGDFFGSELAACDFNGDRVDDLAVGIPGEDHLGETNAGAVQVHYGSYPKGLAAVGSQFFTQSTPGVPGDVEEADYFGTVLACGDFDGDGFADLAVGVPDATGTQEMFTANLPGTAGAVINHAFVGMFAGHRPGTSGALFLDEISFRR